MNISNRIKRIITKAEEHFELDTENVQDFISVGIYFVPSKSNDYNSFFQVWLDRVVEEDRKEWNSKPRSQIINSKFLVENTELGKAIVELEEILDYEIAAKQRKTPKQENPTKDFVIVNGKKYVLEE